MDKFIERKCTDNCEYKLMVQSLSKSLAKYQRAGVTPEEINIREEEIQRLLCEVRELKKQLIREQQKVGTDMEDKVDRCIMCNEPIPEGVQVCYRCRTISYATVAEIRTDDKHLEDLQEENKKLKEELRYKETLLECWQGFANEMLDRFASVVSRKK